MKLELLSDEEIKKLDLEYCAWGDTVHYSSNPKVFRDCEGSFMFDLKDIPYLDLQMWYASCNFGYKNKRILNATVNQLMTMPQIAPKYLYDYKVLLAQKIALANKKRFNEKGRVHFNVGGAQAVEDAIKLSRNYTKSQGIFAFMGGYHGRTMGAAGVTSSYRYREQYGHFGDRAQFIPFPYCFRCHYGKTCDNCNFYCVKQFAKNFESEYNSFYNPKTGNCEYKTFIGEAILGTGGYINPPEGYFKALKKVLDDFGIMLIIDEIQMGIYRTGKLWAIENYGITPDVITFAKSITNGMNPLSGLWAKEKFISPEVFKPGSAHSTYASNPIGTRTGYEVMSIVEEGNFEETIPQKSARFMAGLKYLKNKYPQFIGDIGGIGLALRIELTQKDGITPNKTLCDAIQEEGLKGDLRYNGKKCGIVLNNGGFYKNIITIVPSLFISDDEIDMSIDLLSQLFARFV